MSSVKLALDRFCFRQFDDPSYSGSRIVGMSKAEFERRVNEIYTQRGGEDALQPGYAPFCKHLFVPNFTTAEVAVEKITKENQHLLLTGYEARTERELPVLARYFPKQVMQPRVAKYLDIILYSREQIEKENASMGLELVETDAPWGIISVKAQDVDHELPMNPITAMRNALGKEEGGSGIPLVRDEYQKCVDYWKDHAVVK